MRTARTFQEELDEWQQWSGALRAFAQSAAEVEIELISELEAQLINDREGLFALCEKGPKLSLLLNCFGACTETVLTLEHLNSMDLMVISPEELKSLIVNLPRDQQIAALYTQERLSYGKLPFGEHECAICNCETADEMAAFLDEQGMQKVTADLINQTGAFGRGSLLFLTTQELQLDNDKVQKALLSKARADHHKI